MKSTEMIEISTDKNLLDLKMIHAFLTNAYWAEGRSFETVQKSIDCSLCFGVYLDKNQIGFARVVTDYTIFSYLMDVFILPEHQKRGYAKTLLNAIFKESKLKNCQQWMLKTGDAHALYEQYGFEVLDDYKKFMKKT